MLRLSFRDPKLVRVALKLPSCLARLWHPPITHPLFILQAGDKGVCAKPAAFNPSWTHWSDPTLIRNPRHKIFTAQSVDRPGEKKMCTLFLILGFVIDVTEIQHVIKFE